MVDTTLHTQVREEIEELHRFFVDWFTGACAETDEIFKNGFLNHFDRDFKLIYPAGTILELSTLADGIRLSYGSNPDFRIAIREVTIHHTWDQYVLATYEEWQRNSLQSIPPDNGRLASALIHCGDDIQWLHVHESWLPKPVMEAGPYDF